MFSIRRGDNEADDDTDDDDSDEREDERDAVSDESENVHAEDGQVQSRNGESVRSEDNNQADDADDD